MDQRMSKLIGSLIGLARATEGNEHLITQEVTSTVITCLRAAHNENADFSYLERKIEEAKRGMVPNCYLCASPCGRTSAYNLELLQKEHESTRQLKYRILDSLLKLAGHDFEKTHESLYYKGLIVIGLEDLSVDFLLSVDEEIEMQM